MQRVRSIEVARLHIILCFAFDHHAAATDIDSYRGALIDCPDVCHAVETSGTFDFFVEFDLPDLQSYNDWLKVLVEPLPSFVTRYEACFVVCRFGRSADAPDGDLWLPSRDGLRRVERNHIDMVQAEGDYVRIHSGAQSWLLHTTMAAMVTRLDADEFIRIHRSTIVRRSFIARLIHREGRWFAEMVDGSTRRIAKSQAPATLRGMKADPSSPKAVSPKDDRATDSAGRSAESHLALGPRTKDTALLHDSEATKEGIMSILFRSISALAIGASAFPAAPTQARTAPLVVTAPHSDLPTRRVSYADLNLAALDGQRVLHTRLDSAVNGVCTDGGFPATELGFVECRLHAWSGVRPQVANAIQRATEIATTGHSALPVAAITIVAN